MSVQLDFLEKRGVWQWHGRQLFTELRNDLRLQRKLGRVVYHLSDCLDADNESDAVKRASELFPDAQTVSLFRVCDAEDLNP